MKKEKIIQEKEVLMKISDVQKTLGFSRTFIIKAKDQLGLPFYKIGGAVRFKNSEIQEWINQRRVTN